MPTVTQSKLLSLILRHEPQRAGLALGPGGWVSVDELLDGLSTLGEPMERAELLEIIETNDKQRFTLSEDGTRIRAAQGHSVKIESDMKPIDPPMNLFHGTATRFLRQIREEGLKPMSRLYVHLSGDYETAVKVGQRHGKPNVLLIKSQQMAQEGHDFFQADNEVWLTRHIPPAFIEFEEEI